MTIEDIIQQILQKQPDLTREQILQSFQAEKTKTAGLISDETLLRLIAAKYGVQVSHNRVCSASLSSGRLFAGLNDVTVKGRVIAVFPVKTFQGEKSGKFATLLIVDNDGVLRVLLWNDKADLVEKDELKPDQIVLFSHGYTRDDYHGKTELHLGTKSQIEIQTGGNDDYPPVERFATKISQLSKACKSVILAGAVKEVSDVSSFTRSGGGTGLFLRFTLADDSGSVKAVAWNEKAQELEKTLKLNSSIRIINGRVKESQTGVIEVHVDSNAYVRVQPAT